MQNFILTVMTCFLLFSCSKYVRTEKVCDKKLYVEVYERMQLGITYLTDSTNFKIYVGQLNFGIERYLYKCVSDTLWIFESSHNYRTGEDKIIYEYKYNIKELEKAKDFKNSAYPSKFPYS